MKLPHHIFYCCLLVAMYFLAGMVSTAFGWNRAEQIITQVAFCLMIAVTWAAQMLAVATVILDNPDKAPLVMNAIASLDTIWTVGLSVLGIYVYKRSKEKSTQF